ncbi:MAG: SufE family protein [Verrucomicrobiota bacterium]
MASGLESKRQTLADELSFIEDPYERFAYIIDLGKQHPAVADEFKKPMFEVEGCTSQLWLVPEFKEGRCHFHCDADAQIVKGIASVVCSYYSDETPKDVIENEPDFLGDLGITQHLSSSRRNGLGLIRQKIKSFAESCLNEAS